MAAHWVRFLHGDEACVGKLEGNTIVVHSGVDIFNPGKATGSVVPTSKTKLLAPFEPRSIIALWNNFHERASKENQELPSFPLYFLKPTTSVIGPGGTIFRPLGKNQDDGAPVRVIFEAELGVVIGKQCKEVSEADAAKYVLGYTCVNDVTAPKILFEYKSKVAFQQWSRSKGYDTFTPLGPVVTSGIDPNALRVKAVLDGEVLQDYPVSDMVFSPLRAISMLSHVQTLMPGDLISLGTSVGAGPMNSGQEIVVDIEGIGALRNIFTDRPKSKL